MRLRVLQGLNKGPLLWGLGSCCASLSSRALQPARMLSCQAVEHPDQHVQHLVNIKPQLVKLGLFDRAYVELTHVPPTTLSRSIQKALQYFEGKVLGPEDTAALIKQLCDAQQEVHLMSASERTFQSLPPLKYWDTGTTLDIKKHAPAPKRPLAEWADVPEIIMRELPTWLEQLPDTRSFYPPIPAQIVSACEEAVAARTVQNVLEIVQRVLGVAGIEARFLQMPSLKAVRAPATAAPPPSPHCRPSSIEVEGRLVDMIDTSDFVLLHGNKAVLVVQIKQPPLLAAARGRSLANIMNQGSNSGGGSNVAQAEVSQHALSSVLGQAEAYCDLYDAPVFVVTTYEDTWLGCIEGGRLHVSQGVVTCTELLALLASLGGVFSGDLPAHLSVESEELPASPHLLVGISWYSTEPTTIQAVLWLALKGMGLVGGASPPPSAFVNRPARESTNSSCGSGTSSGGSTSSQNDGVAESTSAGQQGRNPAPGSWLAGEGTSSSSSRDASNSGSISPQDDVGPDGATGDTSGRTSPSPQSTEASTGTERGEVAYQEVPPSPGGGVLGTGATGYILAGRCGDVPVAVKYASRGTDLEADLIHEAQVYTAVQGPHTPRLVWHGPVTGGFYMLLTSRVFGRKLRAGGADAELLPRALAALRAVHAAGYLHGDADNPANFLLVQRPPAGDLAEGRTGSSLQQADVVILDFGLARKSQNVEEQEEEEEQLRSMLCGHAYSDNCSNDGTGGG